MDLINKRNVGEKIVNDQTAMCALRRQILYHSASYDQPPTVGELREMIKEQCNVKCCKETIRFILERLGFCFETHLRCGSTLQQRKVLIENTEQAQSRISFLNTLHRCRESGMKIAYLSGGSILPYVSGSSVGNDRLISSRTYLINIGCEWAQFDLNTALFSNTNVGIVLQKHLEAWISSTLVNILGSKVQGVLLVLCPLPFYGASRFPLPNAASSISEIVQRLESFQIAYPLNASKTELLETLYKNLPLDEERFLDQVLQTHGIQSVRLPNHLQDANPVEMIWRAIRDYAIHNRTKHVRLLLSSSELASELNNLWPCFVENTTQIQRSLLEWSKAVDEKLNNFSSTKVANNDDTTSSRSYDRSCNGQKNKMELLNSVEELQWLKDIFEEGVWNEIVSLIQESRNSLATSNGHVEQNMPS